MPMYKSPFLVPTVIVCNDSVYLRRTWDCPTLINLLPILCAADTFIDIHIYIYP